MKIKLYRAIHSIGKAGEEVDVTSEIGSQLVCQGRCVVISHGSPPQDAMVSKLIAPPPEVEDKPLKIAIVPESTGDFNDAPEQEAETSQQKETNEQSAGRSSNPQAKQRRTKES